MVKEKGAQDQNCIDDTLAQSDEIEQEIQAEQQN